MRIASKKLRKKYAVGRTCWTEIRKAAGIPPRARFLDDSRIEKFFAENPDWKMAGKKKQPETITK